MNKFCRSCEDKDRGSVDCALIPIRKVALLKGMAAVQRIDESGPMFPHEAIAISFRSSSGNTPRQINWRYNATVQACVEAHMPKLPDNVVNIR